MVKTDQNWGVTDEDFAKLTEFRPWARQPHESAARYAAYRCYRDLPITRRSLARVARETQTTREEIEGWAHVDRWDIRNELYDRWIAEVMDRQQEDAVAGIAKDAGLRAAEIYRLTNETLLREVTRLNFRSANTPFHGSVEGPIKVSELKTLIDLQAHFPRVEGNEEIDFDKLSDEELMQAMEAKETYERLRRKAGGK